MPKEERKREDDGQRARYKVFFYINIFIFKSYIRFDIFFTFR